MTKKQPGWIVKHPKYGTWFLPKSAVAKDWEADHLAYYGKKAKAGEETIQTWFHEQFGWCEIFHYGKQTKKPDMKAWEQIFLRQMEKDTNYIVDTDYEVQE